MKKILALVLAVVMMLTAIPFAFAVNTEKPFDNSSFYKVNDDYTLHYRVYEAKGEEKNQILLIHGFCLSTATFEGLAEIYAENGYRTILVDVPNFGYSSRETDDTELGQRRCYIRTYGKPWRYLHSWRSLNGRRSCNQSCNRPS